MVVPGRGRLVEWKMTIERKKIKESIYTYTYVYIYILYIVDDIVEVLKFKALNKHRYTTKRSFFF